MRLVVRLLVVHLNSCDQPLQADYADSIQSSIASCRCGCLAPATRFSFRATPQGTDDTALCFNGYLRCVHTLFHTLFHTGPTGVCFMFHVLMTVKAELETSPRYHSCKRWSGHVSGTYIGGINICACSRHGRCGVAGTDQGHEHGNSDQAQGLHGS